MSLINQMLRDLDARKAAHGAGSRLPNEVRPLPSAPNSRWPIILVVLVTLLLLGTVGAFYAFPGLMPGRLGILPSPTQPQGSPLASIPAQEPLATTAPVTETANPVTNSPTARDGLPAEVVTEGEAKAVKESELQVLGGSLRMDDMLSLPEKAAKTPDRKVLSGSAPKPAERAARKVEPAPEVRQSDSQDRDAASQSAMPPQIEKTDARSSPRDGAETDYRKAILAVNQGRVDEALAGLRSALHQDSVHPAARQLLVKLLLEAKRGEEAEQVLQEGLQTQPAQIAWAMALARLQANRGDLAAAWKTLNFSLPAASGNADYQGFSGHVLQRLGRHTDAIERYVDAARLSPRDGRWWLGLGLSLEAEGRAAEAKEAFQNARASGSLSAELSALVDQKLLH